MSQEVDHAEVSKAPIGWSTPPDVLYHYTDASGFLGILESGSLWATDARFLNDSSEVEYGLGYLKSALVDRCAEGLMRHLAHVVFEDILQSYRQIHTVSYCVDGDLLSQWRGYSGVVGYAIGIDPDACKGLWVNCDDVSPFWPVYYQRSSVRLFADRVAEVIVRDWSKASWYGYYLRSKGKISDLDIVKDISENHLHEMTDIVVRAAAGSSLMAACMKDPAFAEEQEWRTVISVDRRGNRPIRFRQGRAGLVPYVELGVAGGDRRVPLKDVVVGPGPDQDLRVVAASMLLEQCGYGDDVVVRGSSVPFR